MGNRSPCCSGMEVVPCFQPDNVRLDALRECTHNKHKLGSSELLLPSTSANIARILCLQPFAERKFPSRPAILYRTYLSVPAASKSSPSKIEPCPHLGGMELCAICVLLSRTVITARGSNVRHIAGWYLEIFTKS